jgi:hypothetical protein
LYVENATIDGVPVRFFYDTASSANFLFSSTVKKLDLSHKLAPFDVHPGPNDALGRGSLTCRLRSQYADESQLFFEFEQSSETGVHGLLGWPFLRTKVFSIDALALRINFLEAVPTEVDPWMRLRIHPDAHGLVAQLPGTSNFILIDTGDYNGVCLDSTTWSKWRRVNPRAPQTLLEFSYAARDAELSIEAWARELHLDSLTITDTPVNMSDAALKDSSSVPGTIASLGLAAIRRLELVVDGPNGWIYLRRRKTPAIPYPHNRAGVIFLPENDGSSRLSAHVIPWTPAYEAGIRQGDIVVRVDGFRFVPDFMDRSNKRYSVTLSRDGREYQTSFTLRDLIGPNVPGLPQAVEEDFLSPGLGKK